MELITDNWVSWVVLGASLIVLVYMAFVIKHEKDLYLETAKDVILGPFHLLVPGWWSEGANSNDQEKHFHRADTHYDWQAHFKLTSDSAGDLQKLFEQHIQTQNIIFDPEFSIIHDASQKMCRIEGTATADQTERIYYDAFLKRDEKSNTLLLGESKSSILNGSVEGPYFDEVVKRLRTLN